jgi:hypothetical protein
MLSDKIAVIDGFIVTSTRHLGLVRKGEKYYLADKYHSETHILWKNRTFPIGNILDAALNAFNKECRRTS